MANHKTHLLPLSQAARKLDLQQSEVRAAIKRGLLETWPVQAGEPLVDVRALIDYVDKPHRPFEVLKAPAPTKYSVIELFAGAGGMAVGFSNAGLQTRMLVEFDRHACQTLRTNRPDWNVFEGDAAKADYTGVSADIVAGGFPCQAFSFAGKKLGFEDARGTLFFELARAVKEVQPKIVVGENVKGLLAHDKGRTLAAMIDILDSLGYSVKYKVLRAQFFDTPQKRERLVIVGVRKDLGIEFEFPEPKPYVTRLGPALENVPVSPGAVYPEKKRKVLDLVPEGGFWKHLPELEMKEYLGNSINQGGGKTGLARRLSREEPSLTLTCSPAQRQTERCHPLETRPLTVREYARIQAFPDSWKFSGPVASQYKQIGNAVPVNLAYHIGRALIKALGSASQ